VGVKNKLGIGKVADTGYSREDRERRREGGARKSGGTDATGCMSRKGMRGHRRRKVKSRQRRGKSWLIEIIFYKIYFFRKIFPVKFVRVLQGAGACSVQGIGEGMSRDQSVW
jgi:hypothetical protein